MKTLRDVKVGQTASVVKLHGEGALRRRIMDMGITKGTSIYVRKVAPLGDPVEVTVRGYELSIRKGDADCIEVTKSRRKRLHLFPREGCGPQQHASPQAPYPSLPPKEKAQPLRCGPFPHETRGRERKGGAGTRHYF